MRRSLASALAGPSLALAAAACQCAGPEISLYDCRDAGSDCAYCDRSGACVILVDGGAVADGGEAVPDGGDAGGGGGSCAPFLGQRVCSADGVCWEHPLPQGNDLIGIWGTRSTGVGASVWAVGAAGTILHWDGASWALVDSGTRQDLLSVWSDRADEAWVTGVSGTWFKVALPGGVTTVGGVGPNDVADVWGDPISGWIWAVGYGGKVYRVDRSSAPLTASDLSLTNPTTALYAVFGVPGGSTVFATGVNGATYGYDVLTGLKKTSSALPNDGYDLWMASATELYVSAQDGGVYGGDGGGAWGAQPVAPLGDIPAAIWGDATSGELWVRGYDGLTYYRSPARAWTGAVDPSRLNFRDVWGDQTRVWSVGEKGAIATWSAGATWNPASVNLFPPRPQGADLLAGQSVGCEAWAGGRNGQLLRRSDAGWSQSLRAPAAITSLWSSGPGELWYASGDGGHVDRLIGGASAGGYSTRIDGRVLGLSGLNAGAVWAVGEDGGIASFNGVSWARQPSAVGENLNAVLALAPDDVWAAGNDGTVLHFDGGSWAASLAPDSAQPHLRALAASGGRVYAAGGRTLLTHDPSGWSSRVDAPDAVNAVAVDAQGRIWVAGAGGMLAFVKADGGAWTAVGAPLAGDLHALSFSGGELLLAGDGNALLDTVPPP